MSARYHRHSNKDWAAEVIEMVTFQPTPRQHDPVNSTNATPKTTTLSQNDKAKGEAEENFEECMVMCRSASQHTTTTQKRPTTHDPIHNTTTQPTRRDSTTIIKERSESRWSRKTTRSLTSDRQDPRAHPRGERFLKTSTVTLSPSTRHGESKEKNCGRRDKDTCSQQTGNSKACHGTPILIHTRCTKHIREVQHSGPRLTEIFIEEIKLQVSSVYFTHAGYGDEHVQQDEHAHIDRRRLQCASRIKRRTRGNRLQVGQKTHTKRAKQQSPVAQALGSPTPTDTGQHVLQKARLQQSHLSLNQTVRAI